MIERLFLPLLVLSILTACEQPSGPIKDASLFPREYEAYKAAPHYRVMVRGYLGRAERAAGARIWTIGGATGQDTVEGALDTALADCDRYLEDEYGVTIGCQIFAIGDIDVRGMTPEQVGKVIELYKSNPSATYIL